MTRLEAADLYRFYHVGDDETRALRGVSLNLRPGELTVLLGRSGSGKSTLLACLAGLDDPDGGQVNVGGERLSRQPEVRRARLRARHFGVMLQSGNLIPHLNVLDNARLTGALLGQRDTGRALELLDEVDLAHRKHAYPAQLSGGETARAALVAALAHGPALLLADEPTAEVDAVTEDRVAGVIDAFVRQGGSALIATHSPRLAARADRVLRLGDGRWQDA
ncbi:MULTISPECIES: ABC transporter ATP-binding protein [Deinococcus]|uniref:ABC transporter ATP-binding protein n=1 Tax=Deinococcus rufus TaxID=2136097 RepID=A0ABV7Z9J0_9DEIO|nr:ATP-binding cassette domain-containing protein [Deinococcus sp. AB2017081]WQE97197.1 ATP-binding cassette domain-containing protein [Deinococcus sp. AB2017081]